MRKNKGNKVYPSPSPSLSSFSPNRDALSALSLLPAAILALASLLSLEDREVLGYLISRSINTTTNTNTFSSSQEKKKCKKKSSSTPHNNNNNNKNPIFDCGCFDCYTSFWFRWDSSPNRELINQAIEAFEEHLTKGEIIISSPSPSPSSKKGTTTTTGNGGGGRRKKDKMGRRVFDQKLERDQAEEENFIIPILTEMVMVPEKTSTTTVVVAAAAAAADSVPLTESDRDEYVDVMNDEEEEEEEEEIEEVVMTGNLTHSFTETVQLPANKGLVRKVLPDILGVFNSRLWTIWNPSV